MTTEKKRLAIGFAIAAVSDFFSAWLEFLPPLQWAVDVATAGALFLVLGRQWLLLPGLIAEAIPGLALVPFWVLVVASIGVWGTIQPSGKPPTQLNASAKADESEPRNSPPPA